MHIPHQHSQGIYYYPPHQQTTSIPLKFSQSHSNHQIMYRTQPIIHHQRNFVQNQMMEHKINYNIKQSEHLSFRKDLNKPSSIYATDVQVSRLHYFQYQNTQNSNLYKGKIPTNLSLDNSFRNKPLLPIKRKDPINSSINQVNNKGQQQIDELINRLPHIDLQPLNRNSTRSFQSPNIELKLKQIKKVNSPFNFHSKTLSFKDQNNLNLSTKLQLNQNILSFKDQNNLNLSTKLQINQNDQNSNLKEFLKFNSPPKSCNTARSFKEQQKLIQNPEINNKSRGSTRKKSITDTSNSTSMLQSGQYKLNHTGYTLHLPNLKTQSNKQAQFQVNIDQTKLNQLNNLKQILAKAQKDLQEQKTKNYQKQQIIKNLQIQLNTTKINFQKRTLQAQKQFNNKKQLQIIVVKEEFEKQLACFIADIKQKSNQEIRQIYVKLENQLEKAKNQYLEDLKRLENEKKELSNKLDQKINQVNKLIGIINTLQIEKLGQVNKLIGIINTLQIEKLGIVKNLELLQQKNIVLNGQMTRIVYEKQLQQKQKVQIQNIQLQNYNKKIFQSKSSSTGYLVIQQNNITSLNLQIQSLQQKLLQVQNSQQKQTYKYIQTKHQLQKQTYKYIQTKHQLQKSVRKIQQLSVLLQEKDLKCKNMLKDQRNRDRFISDLTNNWQQFENLVKNLNNYIIKLELKVKNQKYKIYQEGYNIKCNVSEMEK